MSRRVWIISGITVFCLAMFGVVGIHRLQDCSARQSQTPAVPHYPNSKLVVREDDNKVSTFSAYYERYVTTDTQQAIFAFYKDKAFCGELNLHITYPVFCEGKADPFGKYHITTYQEADLTYIVIDTQWDKCTWDIIIPSIEN